MFTYGPSVEKTQREWESAPRFVRYFIAFCTFGQWRNTALLKTSSFWGAFWCLLGSLAAIVVLIFGSHAFHR